MLPANVERLGATVRHQDSITLTRENYSNQVQNPWLVVNYEDSL